MNPPWSWFLRKAAGKGPVAQESGHASRGSGFGHHFSCSTSSPLHPDFCKPLGQWEAAPPAEGQHADSPFSSRVRGHPRPAYPPEWSASAVHSPSVLGPCPMASPSYPTVWIVGTVLSRHGGHGLPGAGYLHNSLQAPSCWQNLSAARRRQHCPLQGQPGRRQTRRGHGWPLPPAACLVQNLGGGRP